MRALAAMRASCGPICSGGGTVEAVRSRVGSGLGGFWREVVRFAEGGLLGRFRFVDIVIALDVCDLT